MLFIYTKISRPETEVILCQVLWEFSQHALPLPCYVCIIVTSERHHAVTVTGPYVIFVV